MCFSVLICIVLGQKLALQLSLLIACSNKHSTGPLPHKYCSFLTSSKRGRGLSPCTALPPLNDVVEHHLQSFSFTSPNFRIYLTQFPQSYASFCPNLMQQTFMCFLKSNYLQMGHRNTKKQYLYKISDVWFLSGMLAYEDALFPSKYN